MAFSTKKTEYLYIEQTILLLATQNQETLSS